MDILLASAAGDDGNLLLLVALAVVCGTIVLVSIVSFFARLTVLVRYRRNNRVQAACGLTGEQAARRLCDAMGMENVAVRRAGLLRAIVWGNSYSARKKTVFLRRGIIDKASVTAVALAAQKTGLALLDKEGDKLFRARSRFYPLMVLAPILPVPFILAGLVVDLLMRFGGTFTIVGAAVGLAFYLLGFVATLLNYPVEKKGMAYAVECMEKSGLMTEAEMPRVREVYSAYKTAYITDFVLALLYIVKIVLKLLLAFSKKR